jgi:UDP-glucose 4-epimerase
MNIAVVGGFGFIGNRIVDKLLKEDHNVRIVDIRVSKVPTGAEACIADVTSLNQMVQALSGFDVVYHLAGTVLNTARKNPHLAVSLDVLGTANVLEACVKNNVSKIIYASSFYVYDGLPPELEVDENQRSDIFKAETFGVVKIVGERLILEYARRFNLKYAILRFGPVYGPQDRCTSMIQDLIKSCLQGNQFVVWGAGNRKNQYTYLEDIADGSIAAMSSDNELFNLISPEQVSIRQIAELMATKHGLKVEYDLSKPEGPNMPYISPKKAIARLNWKHKSLEEGIEKSFLEMAKK